MEVRHAWTYSHNAVRQDIVCASDAIFGLCSTLDRLGTRPTIIVCGPTILHSADVVHAFSRPLLAPGNTACYPFGGS
ncbi:hypothetical protein NKDENANG_03198 [Candidatus Entotheonellaceae bacterium PAL068K]